MKVTYIAVQEHFRKSKTIDKFFKDQFKQNRNLAWSLLNLKYLA